MFGVLAAGGTPLSYQWRFNGANLAGASGSSYSVLNAQATNAGSYAVVVTNVAGGVTSSPARLSVGGPPLFISVAGTNVTLSCTGLAGFQVRSATNAETESNRGPWSWASSLVAQCAPH